MSNYLTNARRAVIAHVKDHADVADLSVRRWYTHESGDYRPLQIAASDCPAVEFLPVSLREPRATNVSHEPSLDLRVVLSSRGLDVDPLEQMLAAILAALADGEADNFGLTAANGAYQYRYGTVNFQKLVQRDDDPETEAAMQLHVGWSARFEYTLIFRRLATAVT